MLECYVNGTVFPRVYYGKYVIAVEEVDMLHGLEHGTTAKRFEENKQSLILKEDYYVCRRAVYELKDCPIVFLTASGYLKLTDGADIQGEMFNYYFSGRPKCLDRITDKLKWYSEINELLEGMEPMRILSTAYKSISDIYGVNLTIYKKKYLKRYKQEENVSTLEIVYWLETQGIISLGTLKLILSRIKDGGKDAACT